MKSRFRNSRSRKKKESELDITSLLDILVILLVFLLKSYNASDLRVDLVKGLEIPESSSEKLGNHSIIIQVNSDKEVFLGNKSIGFIQDEEVEIDFLLEKLTEVKTNLEDREERVATRSPSSVVDGKEDNKRNVNIILDKSLSYLVMRQVMHTSSIAGFPQFKFIVKGNY